MNDLDPNDERNLTLEEVASLMEVHPHFFQVFVLEEPDENILLLIGLN